MEDEAAQPSDDPAKTKWTSPRNSENFQRVRAELLQLGHAGQTWDTLAFSLGLLPTLLVHGLALERVAELFGTPVFRNASSWTSQDWIKHIPAWQLMLADWEEVRRRLSGDKSFLDPHRKSNSDNPRRHPLRGYGIDVAPLVSTLIVRHEHSQSDDAQLRSLAGRFNHLQAMLTAAAIDYRWASRASVESYLDWIPDSRHEFRAYPIESHRACRTVRWLSEANQAQLLQTMGQASEPRRFLQELLNWEKDITPDEQEADPHKLETAEDLHRRTYPPALTSYMSYWSSIMRGEDLGERRVRSGGGSGSGGGGTSVEGYVPPIEQADAAAKKPSSPAASVTAPPSSGASFGSDLPDEDISPIRLPLVQPDRINATLSGQKWGVMRAAMADTVTPFDIRFLSHSDAARLARFASSQAKSALTSLNRVADRAEEALLALLTLALGQPPAVLAKARIATIERGPTGATPARTPLGNGARVLTLEEAVDISIEAPVLLVSPPEAQPIEPPWLIKTLDEAKASSSAVDGHHPTSPLEPIGFLIPAVKPKLAGDGAGNSAQPANLRQTVRNLLIPAGEIGPLLIAHHLNNRLRRGQQGSSSDPDQSVTASGVSPSDEAGNEIGSRLFGSFGEWASSESSPGQSTSDVVEKRISDFLNDDAGCAPPPGYDHWPVRLLRNLLPAHIEATTGDRTSVWLLTSDPAGSSQARLYYTQHTLERLAKAWHLAMDSAGLSLLAKKSSPGAAPVASTSGQAAATDESPQLPSQDAQLPVTWPWREPVLSAWRVGAPFVATVEDVRQLMKTLQARVGEPVELHRRQSLRTHHNALLLLTIVYQDLCTAIRALRSPVTLLRAVEQTDRIRARAGLPQTDEVYVGLADKESYYNQRARLVALPSVLLKQLRTLQSHQIALIARLECFQQWESAPPRVRAMFRLDDQDAPAEVSVAWVESELAKLGFPWPANFARAFLRTRLLERGCAPADLDALLGHRDAGGGAIGLHATFDFENSLQRLQAALASVHAEIGLKAVSSALVTDSLLPDKDILIAPMHLAGPVGRGRSSRPRQEKRVERLSGFWKTVHQRATSDDRRQVLVFLRLLRFWARKGNALAAVLCAIDPVAFAQQQGLLGATAPNQPDATEIPNGVQGSASALEGAAQEIVERLTQLAERSTRARFHMAASWFRLLTRARSMLKDQGLEVPALPLVAIVRPPSSPFVEQSVLAIPIVDGWRQALLNWMEQAFTDVRAWRATNPPIEQAGRSPAVGMPMPDPPSVMAAEGWATALVMSAALNGMLLDMTQLSLLLRRFCTPGGRDLPLSGPHGRAHLDFYVAASGAVDRQTHRWWFDPMTELIWLNAPPMPRELRLGDLHRWLRRISTMSFKGSVSIPLEPFSFSDLIRCAEVWWLTRASRTVVATQRRQIDASSILTDRWGRLIGARRLKAPSHLGEQSKPQPPGDVSNPY